MKERNDRAAQGGLARVRSLSADERFG